jgi:hypothetical protein
MEQIDRDVMRTHPDMHFFSGDSAEAEQHRREMKRCTRTYIYITINSCRSWLCWWFVSGLLVDHKPAGIMFLLFRAPLHYCRAQEATAVTDAPPAAVFNKLLKERSNTSQ